MSNYEAKTTTKETTLTEYSGNAGYNEGLGYLTNEQNAPNTNRQFTSNFEYSGIAGDGVGAQMSQENMCNALLNVNKEKIAKGRAPTQNNVKLVSGEESMNIHIRKNECDRVNQRGATGVKLPSKIPSLNNCALTELKTEYKKDERLDPILLNSLKNNPYALRVLGIKN